MSEWAHAIDILHPTLPVTGQQITIYMFQVVWNYTLSSWELHNCHLHQNVGQHSIPNYQQAMTNHYKCKLPPATQEALFHVLMNFL